MNIASARSIERCFGQNEREERRFARVVRADESDAIAAHLERDILEENAPGERFADLRDGEHRVDGHCSCERMDRKCESVAARSQFDHA
jgi:hypothetical protein